MKKITLFFLFVAFSHSLWANGLEVINSFMNPVQDLGFQPQRSPLPGNTSFANQWRYLDIVDKSEQMRYLLSQDRGQVQAKIEALEKKKNKSSAERIRLDQLKRLNNGIDVARRLKDCGKGESLKQIDYDKILLSACKPSSLGSLAKETNEVLKKTGKVGVKDLLQDVAKKHWLINALYYEARSGVRFSKAQIKQLCDCDFNEIEKARVLARDYVGGKVDFKAESESFYDNFTRRSKIIAMAPNAKAKDQAQDEYDKHFKQFWGTQYGQLFQSDQSKKLLKQLLSKESSRGTFLKALSTRKISSQRPSMSWRRNRSRWHYQPSKKIRDFEFKHILDSLKKDLKGIKEGKKEAALLKKYPQYAGQVFVYNPEYTKLLCDNQSLLDIVPNTPAGDLKGALPGYLATTSAVSAKAYEGQKEAVLKKMRAFNSEVLGSEEKIFDSEIDMGLGYRHMLVSSETSPEVAKKMREGIKRKWQTFGFDRYKSLGEVIDAINTDKDLKDLFAKTGKVLKKDKGMMLRYLAMTAHLDPALREDLLKRLKGSEGKKITPQAFAELIREMFSKQPGMCSLTTINQKTWENIVSSYGE